MGTRGGGQRSRRSHDRQLDKARLARRVVNALRALAVVLRLRVEDVRHEGLWIAVVQWKPGGLHLHHEAVSGQEYVIRRRQREAIGERNVGFDRLRLVEAFAISAAQDIHRNSQLITPELRYPGEL